MHSGPDGGFVTAVYQIVDDYLSDAVDEVEADLKRAYLARGQEMGPELEHAFKEVGIRCRVHRFCVQHQVI
jgi:hypothetical protein